MFEKTSKLAEKVASSLSRRHFLGSVGRWAGATALAMAGVLTNAGTARAGSKTCCSYGLGLLVRPRRPAAVPPSILFWIRIRWEAAGIASLLTETRPRLSARERRRQCDSRPCLTGDVRHGTCLE